MEFKMKQEFYNLKYGKCYLLKRAKDLYLVYADKCFNHYIVCTYIEPNSKAMMIQEFFSTVNDKIRMYKKRKIRMYSFVHKFPNKSAFFF